MGMSSQTTIPAVPKRVGWLHFWNDFTLDFVTPLLPASVGAAWIGAMEGIADAVGHLLRVFTGRASDRAGVRVPFVRAGYLTNSFARPLISVGLFLAWPAWILAFRVLDRVGKGIRGSASDALVADWTEGEQRGRAFSLMRVMDHAGATLGALCAAAFAYWFQAELAWAVAALALPALCVVWLCKGLADKPREVTITVVSTPVGLWPRARALDRPLLSIALASVGLRLSPLLILVRVSGEGKDRWPIWVACLAWAALGIVQALSASAAGRILERIGARSTLRWSWLLGAVVFAGLALAPSTWLALVGLGWAVLAGGTEGAEKTWLASLAPKEERALAFGALALVSAVGALVGSALCGLALAWVGGIAFALPVFGLVAGLLVLPRK